MNDSQLIRLVNERAHSLIARAEGAPHREKDREAIFEAALGEVLANAAALAPEAAASVRC
jgi:hypothetical protein